MRVLFISRATLFSDRGGDTVQVENTACALKRFGVDTDIELCSNKNIDYSRYDLIHFFNIIRPADIIYHIDKSRIPFVVSPIYLTYEETTKYSKSLKNKVLRLFGKHGQEYVKCVARKMINREKIISRKYILLGQKKSIEYILKRCTCLLPNSLSEYERLHKDFRCAGNFSVVPNAVDTEIFTEEKNTMRKENSVICVGRIEPRKNQLNLIRALENSDYQLTIAGAASTNHQAYFEECKRAASSRVTFIDFSDQKIISKLYNEHKTHVLASWFETTGLSSLEAAACGCNIVVSDKGDTRNYFSEAGYYCNPADLESIKQAIDTAMNAPANRRFMNKILKEYTWQKTAAATLKVYRSVLKKQKNGTI
ncbi:hypothetical protein A9P82_03455 [Arachidicoccus ginsenosidimutans]|uniref:glycosyltransferase family 4 protein n=1 Tax=Arachidicoccus sp. BS20 TaxID=1850526 RepID=UPI0007F0A54B|nr:glycosyltransferase family 4 protein [Arachidicoccus sp. BS20]ANI88441.1 hypothetical protein A9P82_03455 [Arachidicoccus sp. BS20]